MSSDPYIEIPVYDPTGKLVDKIILPEKVQYISGRCSGSESGYFYKGSGIEYRGHSVWDPENRIKDKFVNIVSSDIPYISYSGEYIDFRNKFGIFLVRNQPYFSDYIGACGPKEENLIFTTKNMPGHLLGVEVDDIIHLPIEGHSIYKVRYTSPRNEVLPDPLNLIELVMFIIQGSWYCPWDKNLISDIDQEGRLRDPADWKFESKQDFTKALGTLYSLMYSLYQTDVETYKNLISLLGLSKIFENENSQIQKIPLVCDIIIYKYNPDLVPADAVFSEYNYDSYKHLFIDYIFNCDPCCCIESKNFNWVKEEYKRLFLQRTSNR